MRADILAINTVSQVVARLITAVSTLLITLLLAAYFGLDTYGDFTKITAVVGLFYLLVDFGLNAIYLHHEEKGGFADFLSLRMLFSSLLVGLLVFVVTLVSFTTKIVSSQVALGISIFSLTIISQAVLYTASVSFQKNARYHLLTKAQAYGAAVSVVGVLISVIWLSSFVGVLWGLVAGTIVSAVLAVHLSQERVSLSLPPLSLVKTLFWEGLPLGLMLLCNLVYFRSDIFLLSYFVSTMDVGTYGFAYRFFDFLIATPLFLANVLYPTLISHKNDPTLFAMHARKYIFLFFLISLPVTMGSFLAAPLLGILNEEFRLAVWPLQMLILALPFFYLSNIMQWILITKKHQYYLLAVYVVSAGGNVLLNLYFIPLYSYNASAVLTGVSEGAVLFLLFMKVRKYI